MKISPEIEIADFDVPSLVREKMPTPVASGVIAPGIASGIAPAIPGVGRRDFLLSELSSEDLHLLCERSTNAVFQKANKTRITLFKAKENDPVAHKPLRLSSEDKHNAACSGCSACCGADKEGVYSD